MRADSDRWNRNIQMATRWDSAGIVEASKQFQRVNGHVRLNARTPRSNGMSEPKLPARTAMITT